MVTIYVQQVSQNSTILHWLDGGWPQELVMILGEVAHFQKSDSR